MSQRLLHTLLAALLLALSACSAQPVVIDHKTETAPLRSNLVYVDNHGWHTGFVIPAEKLEADLPFLTKRFTSRPLYYEIGWGDKGFYQSHEITIGLTLRAMFWSSGSVVHVVAIPEAPADYLPDSEMIPLLLSDSEYSDLRKYIASSFSYDTRGNVIELQQGIYGDSQFYEGNGTYHILNTCNKWTARGLKSSGLDISTPFKLTASSVMDYLKKKNTPAKTQHAQPRPSH